MKVSLFISAPLLVPTLLLASCAATPQPVPERVVETVEVLIPVPVSCVPETLGGPPSYVDTDEALRATAAEPAEGYRLVIRGREQRDSRLAEVEYALEKCKDIPYAQ